MKNESKKHFFQIICGFSRGFGACSNPTGDKSEIMPGNDNTGTITGTYSGTKNNINYTLVFSQPAVKAVHVVGEIYTLTVKGEEVKTSTGKVVDLANNGYAIQPSYKDSPFFTSTVSGTSITGIYGLITFTDGTTMEGPGSFLTGGGGGSGSSGVGGSIAVTGVSLNQTSITLDVNDACLLVPVIAPSNATNKNVTWSSDTPAIATVSMYGVVTAVASGSATITVTTVDGSYSATCGVTVKAPIMLSISVSGTPTLTPIFTTGHDERSSTISVTIPALGSSETVTIGLASNSYGLSLTSGANVTGPSPATLTLTYDGLTEVTTISSVSVAFTVSTAGYSLTGSPAVNVTIIDGQAASRAIPVTKANIKYFNMFTTDIVTRSIGLVLHYKLTENIVASDLRTDIDVNNNWVAIGGDGYDFKGSFDGQSYTITGINIEVALDFQGVFGCMDRNGMDFNTGVVKNLGLINCSIVCSSTNDYMNGCYGSVVGRNQFGTIQNCFTSGNISGHANTGGVVGASGGMVQNCYTSCDVSDQGGLYNIQSFGGVVGTNNGTVQNCYSSGNVIIRNINVPSINSQIGGVVGQNLAGVIKNCYATGDVSGDGVVGGVVGNLSGLNQVDCFVVNCFATGNVKGNEGVGGVVGWIMQGGSVLKCTALNPTITRDVGSYTNFGRIAGGNGGTLPVGGTVTSGTLSNNYANQGMTEVGGFTFTGINTHDGLDGADITLAATQSQAWWENAGFAFGSDDDHPWKWSKTVMIGGTPVAVPKLYFEP